MLQFNRLRLPKACNVTVQQTTCCLMCFDRIVQSDRIQIFLVTTLERSKIHIYIAISVTVRMPVCMTDEDCNGGRCEFDEYDGFMWCTGCPPLTTGYQCECK